MVRFEFRNKIWVRDKIIVRFRVNAKALLRLGLGQMIGLGLKIGLQFQSRAEKVRWLGLGPISRAAVRIRAEGLGEGHN